MNLIQYMHGLPLPDVSLREEANAVFKGLLTRDDIHIPGIFPQLNEIPLDGQRPRLGLLTNLLTPYEIFDELIENLEPEFAVRGLAGLSKEEFHTLFSVGFRSGFDVNARARRDAHGGYVLEVDYGMWWFVASVASFVALASRPMAEEAPETVPTGSGSLGDDVLVQDRPVVALLKIMLTSVEFLQGTAKLVPKDPMQAFFAHALSKCMKRFVLAHEIAHCLLGHLSGKANAQQEFDADSMALKLLVDAEIGTLCQDFNGLVFGYVGADAFLGVLNILERLLGTELRDHPSAQDRRDSLREAIRDYLPNAAESLVDGRAVPLGQLLDFEASIALESDALASWATQITKNSYSQANSIAKTDIRSDEASTVHKLVDLARGRCCTHRILSGSFPGDMNLMRVLADANVKRERWKLLNHDDCAVEMAHGDRDETYYVPLCHDCASKISNSGNSGISRRQLHLEWRHWLQLPRSLSIGSKVELGQRFPGAWPDKRTLKLPEPTLTAKIWLERYGCTVEREALQDENYLSFRTRTISGIVKILRDEGESVQGGDNWDAFRLTTDPHVWIPREWQRFTVSEKVEPNEQIGISTPLRTEFEPHYRFSHKELQERAKAAVL